MKKVLFQLNKKLDKEIILDFLSAAEAGVDFGAGIRALHPKLGTKKPTKQVVSKYADAFYMEHIKALEHTRAAFEKTWQPAEKKYFTAVEKVFGKAHTPKKGYRTFLSVVDCNPRFLETKSFQIYWKHKDGVRFVVAHEILHFFFFEYVKKYLPKLYTHPLLWDVSEVFNSVVLIDPMFVKAHGVKRIVAYPAHRRYLLAARHAWRKRASTKEFIHKIFEIVGNASDVEK